MKKVLKPFQEEESVFYSDFTGKCFGDFEPEVNLTMHFNYGSKHDGATLKLHLSDKESEKLLEVIKQNLSPDTKEEFRKRLEKYSNDFQDSVDARDWNQSEYYSNSSSLLKYIIE